MKNQLRDCETDNVTHQVDGRKQALQSRQTITSTPLEAEDEAANEIHHMKSPGPAMFDFIPYSGIALQLAPQ